MVPPEQVKREIVRQWMAKAQGDLRVAQASASLLPPELDSACFHAQQAAEKYLKAFLTWRQVEFPKTHDIRELLDLVATVHQALASRLASAATLTPYGVDVRYPGQTPAPEPDDVTEALQLADKVRDAVTELLKEC